MACGSLRLRYRHKTVKRHADKLTHGPSPGRKHGAVRCPHRYAGRRSPDHFHRKPHGLANVAHQQQTGWIKFGCRHQRSCLTISVDVTRAEVDARAAADQRVVTTSLRESLSEMTNGDLSRDINAEFPPAYAELKSNFNAALGSLRELIGAVAQSAVTIRTGSGEIAQASEDLARRTESNAASLEETSAAITQMDDRLRATAAAAGRTVQRADGAMAVVDSGRSVADEAVQAMGRVSESAKGIDSVIEGLDKIAFQTRVLAMNAGVEAGRAGDAGRAFAVVADLVSALAMRSEEEAKRAREQLTATQTDIGAAVEAVQKVDGAFAEHLVRRVAGAQPAQRDRNRQPCTVLDYYADQRRDRHDGSGNAAECRDGGGNFGRRTQPQQRSHRIGRPCIDVQHRRYVSQGGRQAQPSALRR